MERRKMEKMLFNDESMFCISYGNQSIWVRRIKQEEFDKGFLKHSIKFAVRVTVYGCMSAGGPGKLCIVYEKVNS